MKIYRYNNISQDMVYREEETISQYMSDVVEFRIRLDVMFNFFEFRNQRTEMFSAICRNIRSEMFK